jgi:hypothetical protein
MRGSGIVRTAIVAALLLPLAAGAGGNGAAPSEVGAPNAAAAAPATGGSAASPAPAPFSVGGPPAAAPSLPPPASHDPVLFPHPFAKGEKLRYALAWLAVGGGEMSITTAPPAPHRGKSAYTITLEANSNDFFSNFFLVRDTIISVVEATRFETLRFEKHTEEGKRVKDIVQVFDLDNRVSYYQGKKVSIPPHVLDTLSAVWYLRLIPLEVGKPVLLDAHNNGKNYTLRVDVLEKEVISVPAGKFPAIRLEPKMAGGFFKAKEGKLLIWLSDDANRTPLRIRTYLPVGHVTASLLAPDQAAPSGKGAFPEEEKKK